jgi:3-deoxy-D-manno-octulosonic-acid transferase
MDRIYRAAARLLHRLPYPAGTLARSLAGRRGAGERWRGWAAGRGSGTLLWAHAASVGESLALVPVVERLRVRLRDVRVILTHTSPSVADHGPGRAFHRIDYLPLDEPRPMTDALDALRPALLLFSRSDLWPELVTRAAGRGIPVAVSGGIVRARSGRLRGPAAWALRSMHRRVAWVGAVSGEDATRWRRLGVPADRVVVTGDPRHDQVAERVPDLRPAALWAGGRPGGWLTLVAGSIEPDDDAVLAEAARLAGSAWRWLVVPHATGHDRLAQVESAFRNRGVSVARWDGTSAAPAGGVTLFTRQGLLADLYYAADAAWLGGGFRDGSLHAACEAAVVGVPIVAGPRLSTARDGALLEQAGAATPVADAGALARQLTAWGQSPERRRDQGLRARGALETGAAGRTAHAVATLIG